MGASNNSNEEGKRLPNLVTKALRDFASHFPLNLREHFEQFNFKSSKKNDHLTTSEFPLRSNKELSAVELSLEKQMDAWKHNPLWVDHPPDIKEVISRKVVVDEGLRQVVEVEQAAIWRFLWLSGTITVRVLVDQNREDHTVKFKQIKSGFMEKFEGCWKVEPLFVDEELCHPFKPKSVMEYACCSKGRGRIGSKLTLEQLIQPAIVPPPPISWYLRGITTKTTEMLFDDLLTEAARIREVTRTNVSDEKSGEGAACNIKERWAMRRKNTRRCRRRLFES
ncbi:hypothetical protein ACS0TY_010251 [Phlomoides rotata]